MQSLWYTGKSQLFHEVEIIQYNLIECQMHFGFFLPLYEFVKIMIHRGKILNPLLLSCFMCASYFILMTEAFWLVTATMMPHANLGKRIAVPKLSSSFKRLCSRARAFPGGIITLHSIKGS